MSEKQFNEFLGKYNLNRNLTINENNVNEVLKYIWRKYYIDELRDGRLGQRIKRDILLNGNINIRVLLSWIFFMENASKFIMKGKNYLEEIILPKYIKF